MNNSFEKWEINQKTPNDLIFYKIETTYNELKIFLKNLTDQNQVLEIKFEYFASYRVTIDLALMKKVNEISSFRGFAQSKSSNYLNSIIEGSYNIIEENNLEHFLIYNLDNAIEVLSDEPGIFKWVDTENEA